MLVTFELNSSTTVMKTSSVPCAKILNTLNFLSFSWTYLRLKMFSNVIIYDFVLAQMQYTQFMYCNSNMYRKRAEWGGGSRGAPLIGPRPVDWRPTDRPVAIKLFDGCRNRSDGRSNPWIWTLQGVRWWNLMWLRQHISNEDLLHINPSLNGLP